MLAKLRTFIYCRHELSWSELRAAVQDRGALQCAVSVNQVWASIVAADAVGKSNVRALALSAQPSPYVSSVLMLGAGGFVFCKAVKTLLEDGTLQVFPGGRLRYAIDPLTGYHYGHNPRGEPKLPDLRVSIRPVLAVVS